MRKKRFHGHVVSVKSGKQYIFVTFLLFCFLLFCFWEYKDRFPKPNSEFLLHSLHRSVLSFNYDETKKLSYTEYDWLSGSILSIRGSEMMNKEYAAKYGGIVKVNQTIKEKKQEEKKEPVLESDVSAKNITFINTPGFSVNAATLLNEPLSFSSVDEKPKVLIVHTHTSEAYCESEGARSLDNDMNVVAVGAEIKRVLEAEGISVIHDTTKNDNPSYNQSYKKALTVIEKNLQAYPSIEIVLDIHRDYIKRDDGTLVKPTITMENGEKAAQIMFVIGTDHMGLYHPEWRHNLSFSVKIQNRLNELQPGLCRSINIRTERFNQHMTKGSMIIEVGTAANTINESKNSATLIGKAIAQVLK
ncbi:MAG: hypothetical protein E7403_04535 [Ruminococcaceae bacterium]|nr:hypothetical protein [Oscillospiraceae bacterium]